MTAAVAARSAAALLLALVPFLIPLEPSLCHAGAWLRAPGEVYAKASLFRVRGEEEYTVEGAPRALFDPTFYERGRYQETGAGLYAEYGIGPDVTLIADALLKIADVDADGRGGAGDLSAVSFGVPDVRVGVRLPLARGRFVAALEPSAAVPIEGTSGGANGAPRIGTGTASFAAAVSLGAGLPALRGYAQAGGGYRARSGKPPGEWFWDLEAGASAGSLLALRLRYDGVDARGAGDLGAGGAGGAGSAPGSPATSLAAETGGQDAHRIAPTIAVGLGGGCELSVTWRRTFAGRSALRGEEWEVAYSFLGLVGR
ncbi:MAG TPA: hypothetical protein VFT32_07685 [Candidatus Eisenbacteria bacterium]|nr:hypothetical protein [Candidatus Eisenbacteria bacterium]